MSYSPQLVYFLDRLSGFSTNTFKLLPSGSRDVEHLVLLLLQPLALAQEHEEPLLDTDRDFTMSIS